MYPPSMFWDFGSLHQKPRVGGPPGWVRHDGSNGSPAGRQYWETRLCTSSANHRLLGPPTGSEVRDGCDVDGVRVGWSCTSRRCDVTAPFLTCCRGSRISRPCRCGDCGFGGTSQQNITLTVEASCILSCRQACLSFSERRCGVTECLQLRRRTRPPSFSAHTWRIFSVSSVWSLQRSRRSTLLGELARGKDDSWESSLVEELDGV